jgi:hypothetical protein
LSWSGSLHVRFENPQADSQKIKAIDSGFNLNMARGLQAYIQKPSWSLPFNLKTGTAFSAT